MLSFNDNNAQYLIVNSELIKSETLVQKNINTIELPFDGSIVYEVIRFINGKGLFAEDHFKRLEKSCELQNICSLLSYQSFLEFASVLISVNEEKNCNIKIMSNGNDFVIYLSKKYYPEKELYETGVDTAAISIERPNPNIKLRRSDYIERIDNFKLARSVFEVLLINSFGYITEGSKSNLFYVKKEQPDFLYTAPSDMVLEGIMRKYIIKTAESAGITVRYEPLKYDEIKNAEALFLSGTSINVLPIAKVDEMQYNSANNGTVVRIMNAFHNYIDIITKG